MLHLRNIALRWLIVSAIFVPIDLLVSVYAWAHRYSWSSYPVRSYTIVAVVGCAFVLALLWYAYERLADRYPKLGWAIRLSGSRWSSFAPTFRNSRRAITLVFFSYMLFYLTKGIDEQSKWAIWANANIFHFYLLGHEFTAIDVLQIELFGYLTYLVFQVIFSYYCPQILRYAPHSGDTAKLEVPFLFVKTIEQHGHKIPPQHLYNTLNEFVTTSKGRFSAGDLRTIETRLGVLAEMAHRANRPAPSTTPATTATPPNTATPSGALAGGVASPDAAAAISDVEAISRAAAGQGAAVAQSISQLFPDSLSFALYYLGKDLFDILYSGVRLAIRVGLIVALVLTSLPALAKVAVAFFPRIGE